VLVIEIKSVKQFQEVIKKYRVVVVDVWTSWCSPCIKYKPVFRDVARDYESLNYVVFCTLNPEDSEELFNFVINELKVTEVPTTIVFVNGKEEKRVKGYMGRDALKSIVNSCIELTS